MFNESLFSNSTSEIEPTLNLGSYLIDLIFPFIKTFVKQLIFTVVFFLGMSIVWFTTISSFLVINQNLRKEWMKLPEFTIINHAHHVITNHFVKVIAGAVACIVIIIFVYIRYPNYGLIDFFLLLPCGVFWTVWGVYIYIATLFTQVYQFLLARYIFEHSSKLGKDEPQLTELQIGRKQYATKSTIKTLYICCIIRDYVLSPVVACVSVIYFIGSISIETFSLETLFSLKSQFTIFRIFQLIAMDSTILFVPAAVLYYLSQRRNLNNKEHVKNPLQVHIFHQAMIMTGIKVILIALCIIMSLIDQNLSWITTATQLDPILVVVSIQISTTRCFKKRLIAYREGRNLEVVIPTLAPINHDQPPKY
ncbi:Serpentine Receptor, class Z [Caenorhabditis elegans]|uniref:Serpentine Receptor, class Z n=1 Tax=Caenorhabditis elegans TaxID=6239 RepID=O45858_CAEEL|nr:Serpentine Receptor, class Z [Caenorhabditis elegans]CAB05290.2 Serpentine Receptor, class Z [Caenorhabditis elegans]|eukprot:NP_502761.2 Uncharacterized protein CELE_T27E7.3 [Caenorhabditis elegans]